MGTILIDLSKILNESKLDSVEEKRRFKVKRKLWIVRQWLALSHVRSLDTIFQLCAIFNNEKLIFVMNEKQLCTDVIEMLDVSVINYNELTLPFPFDLFSFIAH